MSNILVSTIAGAAMIGILIPVIIAPQKPQVAQKYSVAPRQKESVKTQELAIVSEEVKKLQIEGEEAVANPPAPEKKEEPQPALAHAAAPVNNSVRTRQFRLNSGKMQTGQQIIDYVVGNANGRKLYDAFLAKHGQDVADTAAISLFYENGTLWELTTGVCNPRFQIGGDYRNCNFADINSAGFDAGLKQINTWYQRFRIAKLGGPNCVQSNSRDRTDPCVQQLIAWLHNVDNNIAIALDIYAESGFSPWYGWRRAFSR